MEAVIHRRIEFGRILAGRLRDKVADRCNALAQRFELGGRKPTFRRKTGSEAFQCRADLDGGQHFEFGEPANGKSAR
jgi:hypothetical protein